jgi:hypothetical protein
VCRDYSITPPEFRGLPREDRIAMLADANLRAREMQKATKASKPRPRYNASSTGEQFWTGG